jgi:hypothetical protein
MMLGHLLPSVRTQSFLEWTPSFERSVAEFYTILLEGRVQVAVEMLEVVICSSLQSPKLTRVVQLCSKVVIVLARESAEVHLHALQAMTEQFQL